MSFFSDDLAFMLNDAAGGFSVSALHLNSQTMMPGILSEHFTAPSLGTAIELDTMKPHFQTSTQFKSTVKKNDLIQVNKAPYRINKVFVVFNILFLELYEAEHGRTYT